jgi:sulfur-oxidizing protein SoxX
MPQDMLMHYPCHDDEMPCFNLPAPAIQKVTFKEPLNGNKERGKQIATNIRWGNCIACHSLPEGQAGGSVGPDLSQRGAFPVDLQEMYQRIWDVRIYSPDAHMPIYGTNKVLTDQDIRDVMAYVLSGK